MELYYKLVGSRILLTFGKHRDKWLDEVPTGYLKWIIATASGSGRSSFPDDFLKEVEDELKSRGEWENLL